MRFLVTNANDIPSFLPSWEPKTHVDECLTKHIRELCIPAISGGHCSSITLGRREANWIESVLLGFQKFSLLQNICVLINTFGSGKTRLLEGLCRRWSFYFVTQLDSVGTGSSDRIRFLSGFCASNCDEQGFVKTTFSICSTCTNCEAGSRTAIVGTFLAIEPSC